ncbi:MAG: type I 3-dehydroquinate dehydratase [Lactobacillaceae bacterium]|jgi:3-dehydroquinate dehydratase-1|nr:type I 3-dehydroquinate dehydratase [Lactobacillaceae bacterium]
MTLREVLRLPAKQTGLPVIAVPLTGAVDAFYQQLKLQNPLPDVVEWRVDYWAQTPLAGLPDVLAEVVQNTAGLPLILTYRSTEQGGQGALAPDTYVELVTTLLQTGYSFAALDVEWTLPPAVRHQLIELAHQAHTPFIMSYHDFQQTPPQAELLTQLQLMAASDADVVKLAVMPQTQADVDQLLIVTKTASATLLKPLITMSMGALGQITRINGWQVGSELTFAVMAGTQLSAPGQLTIQDLLAAWAQK